LGQERTVQIEPILSGTPLPSGSPRASVDDLLIAALAKLARDFELPDPGIILRGLAVNSDGTLPFHQAENAADLIGLQYDTLPVGSLPRKSRHFPALIRTRDGAAIIYERSKDQLLYWAHGLAEPVWTDVATVEESFAGQALHIVGNANLRQGEDVSKAPALRGHWFWSELYKLRRQFYPVLWAAFFINLLAFSLPLFTMNVYDRIIPNRATSSLWVLAIGVTLAFAIEFALRLARAGLLDELGRKLDLKLSEKIFGKLINIPLSERTGDTGRLSRRVAEYEIVRDFFASTTLTLLVDFAFMIVFVAMIAVLAGWLAVIPVVIIIGMIAAGMVLQRKMTAAAIDAQHDAGLQNSLLVESISGAETLKSCAAEGRIVSRWRNVASMSAQTQERLRRLSSISVTLASLCQQLTSIALVIGGFYLFDSGTISMGAIIAIVMLAGRSLAPAGQLAFLITRGRQAMTVLDSIGKLMDSGDERVAGSQSVVPQVREGHVRLENMGFAYGENGHPALADINLTVAPGEKIAIIGRVASGKSTLGRLLCGLHFPTDGSVQVDGLDNRQYRPADLRVQLRFVGQDAELFGGSIKDNLLLAAPQAEDAQLIAALRRVGADEFLGRDAGGFDRLAGERGRSLSGGQRAFLLLARAIATPSKLLFLDEPTGAMDTATEKLFIEKLGLALYPGQTLVVSTHRQAILSLCDRLIVMDGGRIIADGPREAILAKAAAQGAAA
jgi:ATP-binding cassette, subfamily C, bacterial LapB